MNYEAKKLSVWRLSPLTRSAHVNQSMYDQSVRD